MDNPERPYDDALEQVRQEYIAAHETGNAPTLDALIARHPEHAAALSEFVLDYRRAASAENRAGVVREEAAPYGASGVERALQSLGFLGKDGREDK